MNTVPKMISSKDLAYLEDMFNWNYLITKKAQYYEEEVNNEEISQEISKLIKLHEEICQDIIKLLKDGKNE